MKQISLTKLWNNSLILEDRELKERDYAWASELGKSKVDRFLAMKAVKPTNPPNDRSRRKFFSGNIWEFIAGLVLWQMGIIINKQEEVWSEDMPLRVKGKLDYLVGGYPDYNKAREVISQLPFQKEITDRFMRVINNFEEEYGHDEIETMVHELKSCSQYVIEKIQGGGCILGHDLQIDHYLRGLKMEKGIIDYISKDDALMAERWIKRNDDTDKKMREDLAELKGYLESNTRPPADPLILFEEKFTKNFNVEYSGYLTLVYGFERPDQYADAVKGKIASWNRVLARLKQIENGEKTKTGKEIKLTPKNEDAIKSMEAEGYDAYTLAKVAQVELEEELV
jgi:hypothetical protein